MLSKVHSKMKATENPFRNLQDSESLPAVQVLLFMTLETLERLVFLGRFNGFRICSDSTLGKSRWLHIFVSASGSAHGKYMNCHYSLHLRFRCSVLRTKRIHYREFVLLSKTMKKLCV